MHQLSILLLLIPLCCTSDYIEGSGEGPMDTDEHRDQLLEVSTTAAATTARARHNQLSVQQHLLQQLHAHAHNTRHSPTRMHSFNVTTSMDVMFVEENLAQNLIQLTLWTIDHWNNSHLLDLTGRRNFGSVHLDPDELFAVTASPKTTVKLAMSLHEWPNSRMARVSDDGRVMFARKMTVSLPCDRISTRQVLTRAEHENRYEQVDYNQPIVYQPIKITKHRCTLTYGSYIQTRDNLNLHWDASGPLNRFDGWTCKLGQTPLGTKPCVVTQAVTMNNVRSKFAGERYMDVSVTFDVETEKPIGPHMVNAQSRMPRRRFEARNTGLAVNGIRRWRRY